MTTLFIGCGRMGAALAKGMAEREEVFFIDPHVEAVQSVRKIGAIDDIVRLGALRLVVLATKPEGVEAACTMIAPFISDETLVVSLAAGIRLERLVSMLGEPAQVVRMMPNLAVTARAGVMAFVMASPPNDEVRVRLARHFGNLGSIFWLRSEQEMDAVTALSGSGPAYLIYMAEQMQREAEQLGLERATAMEMARATLSGIGLLLAQSGETLAEVRAGITSPGGTTAAAIEVLAKKSALPKLMGKAMVAAVERSRMLAGC